MNICIYFNNRIINKKPNQGYFSFYTSLTLVLRGCFKMRQIVALYRLMI